MFKLKELWDNCKLKSHDDQRQNPFFDKHLYSLMNATLPASAPSSDIERNRFFMVEQQIRTWEVLDPVVLDLLMRVHREDFVPPAHRALAFAEMEIPLGHGEMMLSPKTEARMLQSLMIKDSDSVLEIGTGSGFMTALLASLARHVYSVDSISEFSRSAATRLTAAGIANVTLDTGDAARGWDKHGPYDVIVLTGSVPVLPESFQHSLNPGGRLIAVVGEAPVMQTQLVTRAAGGACSTVTLFETCIPPLKNALQPQRFQF
jgi:protein-L-isoaspartate(D-aspartate) O-methyltransferase